MKKLFKGGVARWHLIQFFRQMSVLARAGIPLLRSLDICSRQCSDEDLARGIAGLSQEVRAGTRMAAAMRSVGKPFDPMHASAVSAAETAGRFAQVFDELAHWEFKEDRLRKRLGSALAYPALIVVVSAIGVVLLIKFLLPVILSVAEQLGTPPSGPTRFLIFVGGVIDSPLQLALAGLALGSLIWYVRRVMARRLDLRIRWDRFRMRLPLVGTLWRTTVTIRVCRTLASLLGSGLSMVDAMTLTGASAGSPYLEHQVLVPAAGYIRKGESLSQSLAGETVFPHSFHGMVAVGEKSGELEPILGRLADLYEIELDNQIETFVRAIEPLAVVVVGIVVLGVMVCAFMPLYDLLSGL